ncbi:oxidoreductase [Flexivirga endophytica]|uniref:Oxidoreductase n=1 Tax=Flexivirga endophytica TaxID=1849103 RepID=A0A916TA10_9MICO|nr:aldo/keto reductase [Flexivirga endophytica]GGB35632.1 oxidoreductase [Flexivirga endophytica]GHB43357.1 oxidoreductase [Flexivirga endophytica]
MQSVNVGRSGLRVSDLTLGTMNWGDTVDEIFAEEIMRDFRDAGGTTIDTAYGYGDGAAEQILGDLVAGGDRDDLVLVGKAGISRTTGSRVVDTSRGTLLKQLDASLHRLRTDHLDLWLVHTWADDVPLEETMSALEHAVSTGRARYVGVSNYSGWQLVAAHSILRDARIPLTANEVEYSLVARGPETEVLPAADHVGAGVLAWAPLGGGVLTGKYRRGVPADSRAASGRHTGWAARRLGGTSDSVVDAVATAADGLGASPAQIALSWTRTRPGISSLVVGVRNRTQLRTVLASAETQLPPQIAQALDDVSRVQQV